MKTLHIVCGPTASGKTAYAIELAKHLSTEIISADSRQFFKELPIGSAAPTPKELSQVKHHLVGHLSIQDAYSAAQFAKDAQEIIQDIFKSKDDVVLCGGSGLYIDALLFGFDEIPSVSEEIRNRFNLLFTEKGLEGLHEELRNIDPDFLSDEQLALNPRRCIRALEVYYQTGEKMSEMKKGKKEAKYTYKIYYPSLTREQIYARIDARVYVMMDLGLEKECELVKAFAHMQALQTVGYKEVFAVWNNELEKEALIPTIQLNTRRYAKRQDTWFRNQLIKKTALEDLIYF